jgi:CRP-like cAMP-binding protein
MLERSQQRELSFIAANCRETEAPSGQLLVQQGQVGQDVYLLERGSVCVFRGEASASQSQMFLEAPTILGEMAILDPERIRTSSIVALSDLHLLQIPITTFLIFLRTYPVLKERLREVVAARSAKSAVRAA